MRGTGEGAIGSAVHAVVRGARGGTGDTAGSATDQALNGDLGQNPVEILADQAPTEGPGKSPTERTTGGTETNRLGSPGQRALAGLVAIHGIGHAITDGTGQRGAADSPGPGGQGFAADERGSARGKPLLVERYEILHGSPKPWIKAIEGFSYLGAGTSEIMNDYYLTGPQVPTCHIVVVLPSRERHQRPCWISLLEAAKAVSQEFPRENPPRLKIDET